MDTETLVEETEKLRDESRHAFFTGRFPQGASRFLMRFFATRDEAREAAIELAEYNSNTKYILMKAVSEFSLGEVIEVVEK